MTFEFIAILIGVIAGFWHRGSIWRFQNLSLKYVALLPIGYVLQVFSIQKLNGYAYELCLVTSYVVILVFCWFNLKIPGIRWTAVGSAANFGCMLFNGLRMPAYVPAVKAVAPNMLPLLEQGKIGKSIAMTDHTTLKFLSDIFMFPIYPQCLLSVGDIVFGIGLVIFIHYAMTSKEGEPESSGLSKSS